MRIFLLLITLSYFSTCLSQFDDSAQEEDFSEILQLAVEKYGVDQQIVNGNFYENKYKHALGHPFLHEDKFRNSNLIIRDTEYKDIYTKYDVYEQTLLIKSTIDNYEIMTLMPIEFVMAFSFNDMFFRKYSFTGDAPVYYQVVAEQDEIVCLYFWYKTRVESLHNITFSSYKFRKSMHKNFLLMNDEIGQYKNNRTFVALFPAEVQKEILTYLKSEKLKVKKAIDQEMTGIIEFSNNILKQRSLQ